MSKSQNFTSKLAAFIVDKRYGFFLAFIGSAIFCAVASGWVAVNDDLTSYLPADTETRQGVVLMEEEFITLATADVLVDNISYQQALAVQSLLESIDGVKSVAFDETAEHYKFGGALKGDVRRRDGGCGQFGGYGASQGGAGGAGCVYRQ